MWKQWKEIWKNKKLKGKETMVVLILIGALLAVIALPTDKKGEEEGEARTNQDIECSEEFQGREAYEQQLETRLEEILSQMEGVGKVEVMITLSASARAVVEKDVSLQEENSSSGAKESMNSVWGEMTGNGAENESTGISKEETTVYADTSQGSTPYVIQEIYPEVEGVLVVAEGGGDSYINLSIVESIQALFDVDVHKIKIVKMNTD